MFFFSTSLVVIHPSAKTHSESLETLTKISPQWQRAECWCRIWSSNINGRLKWKIKSQPDQFPKKISLSGSLRDSEWKKPKRRAYPTTSTLPDTNLTLKVEETSDTISASTTTVEDSSIKHGTSSTTWESTLETNPLNAKFATEGLPKRAT